LAGKTARNQSRTTRDRPAKGPLPEGGHGIGPVETDSTEGKNVPPESLEKKARGGGMDRPEINPG